MTEDTRREEASAAREERLDRALDHLLSAAPEPGMPTDLAARILAATSRIPQEPVPARPTPGHARDGRPRRTRPGSRFAGSWFERPRAVAATLAVAAVFGFAAGWAEPLVLPETQSVDVAAVVFGIEPESEL